MVIANFNGNSNHRFGIKTDTPVIAKNSTFYVETVDKNNPQYNDFLSQLDEGRDIENIKFLKIGVRKSDGTEYTILKNLLKYIFNGPRLGMKIISFLCIYLQAKIFLKNL